MFVVHILLSTLIRLFTSTREIYESIVPSLETPQFRKILEQGEQKIKVNYNSVLDVFATVAIQKADNSRSKRKVKQFGKWSELNAMLQNQMLHNEYHRRPSCKDVVKMTENVMKIPDEEFGVIF